MSGITHESQVLDVPRHDKSPFGEHTRDLIVTHIDDDAMIAWTTIKMPLMTRLGFLREREVPREIIRRVHDMWESWCGTGGCSPLCPACIARKNAFTESHAARTDSDSRASCAAEGC